MSILFRFFIDATDVANAQDRASAVFKYIEAHEQNCRVESDPPKAYWKVEGWYEVATEIISNSDNPEAILGRLAKKLGNGWEWMPKGTTAVWSEDKGGQFAVANVHWAELDLDKTSRK